MAVPPHLLPLLFVISQLTRLARWNAVSGDWFWFSTWLFLWKPLSRRWTPKVVGLYKRKKNNWGPRALYRFFILLDPLSPEPPISVTLAMDVFFCLLLECRQRLKLSVSYFFPKFRWKKQRENKKLMVQRDLIEFLQACSNETFNFTSI